MASAFRFEEVEQCTRLLFEAANENSVSKLKLAKKMYCISELMASFSERNEKGETPLAVAMIMKNYYFIDNFLKIIIYGFDSFSVADEGRWQLMFSKIIDQLSHQIPIMKFIEYLINALNADLFEDDCIKFLAQVFIKSTTFSRQDKIIALELIGATLIINGFPTRDALNSWQMFDTSLSSFGLDCWRKAMTLRYFPADSEPLLPKTPIVLVPSEASCVVFGSAVEVMSMEELNLLEGDFFSENPITFTWKRMLRQALLALRRISSQENHGHPHRLYLKKLLMFGSCLDWDEFDEKFFINSCLLIMEQISDPKMLPRYSFDVLMETLWLMSDKFYEEELRKSRYPEEIYRREELSYADLLAPTKFIGTVAKFFPKPTMISEVEFDVFAKNFNFAELVYRFLYILESISHRFTKQENHHLEKYYSYYIRNFFSERTASVLHEVVDHHYGHVDYHYRSVKDKKILELILKLGADPDAIDEKGKTTLHLLAENEFFHFDENGSLFQLFQALVHAGTHLDIAADNGDTVLDILKTNLMRSNESSLIVHPYYESLLNTVFSLSCYCARVIRRHGIRYDEDRIPLTLQEFVSRHSAKKSNDLLEHGENN